MSIQFNKHFMLLKVDGGLRPVKIKNVPADAGTTFAPAVHAGLSPLTRGK
jgi:hypothetical protein